MERIGGKEGMLPERSEWFRSTSVIRSYWYGGVEVLGAFTQNGAKCLHPSG
jgi:hypothetical protein